MTQVGVIGAGPAGLGAAFALVRRAVPVTVFEASPTLGGLARSFELWDEMVDLGPHLLQRDDPRIDEMWTELIGDAHDEVERRTRILSNGRCYTYPYQARDVLRNLGPLAAAGCLASFAASRLQFSGPSTDLESWAVRSYGRRAFDLLFRTYIERLFGLPATEVDRSFTQTLLSGDSGGFIGGVLKQLVTRQDKMPPDRRHLIVRPYGGVGRLMTRLGEFVTRNGGEIICDAPIQSLNLSEGRVRGVTLKGGALVDLDEVISTMPLSLLVRCLPSVPEAVVEAATRLRTRSALLTYCRVEPGPSWRDQWIYVMSRRFRVCRVTNFANFRSVRDESTPAVLVLEYWCGIEDPLWTADNTSLLQLAQDELKDLQLLPDRQMIEDIHVIRVQRAFPVLDLEYKKHVATLMAHVRGVRGLYSIGRFGAFGNESVHSSILMGIDLAAHMSEASYTGH